MVINVLETKDLLELSLLKCKVCQRRLQSPILQIGVFTNVCGSCCDKNAWKDAVRNVDLEALLQKLYFPCNYAKRGCEFEGSFDEVCVHEEVCSFREMKCPLASYKCCGGHMDNIIDHMKSKHPDNVLTVVENHVSVKNPSKERLSVFYLLIVDNLYFILRATLNIKKDQILYMFYCLNYDLNIDQVKVSIVLKYENTICNIDNIHIHRLRKGELSCTLYEKNVIRLSCMILESFGCSESITIKMETTKGIEPVKVNTKLNKSFWYKCTKCLAISQSIHYCSKRNVAICCENCFQGNYSNHCNCYPNRFNPNHPTHIVINLDQINPKSTFLCTNTGCNEEVSGDNYALHTTSQCRFKQITCPFSTSTGCPWESAFIDLFTHLTEEHSDRTNQNYCEISNSRGISEQFCFIKENNTFLQTYQINDNQQLIVTTKKLDDNKYHNNYKWQIYFKHPVNGCEVLTSSMCTNGESKTTIDIADYIDESVFAFKVLFQRVNTVFN